MDDTGRGQQSEHVYLPYLCRKSIYGARRGDKNEKSATENNAIFAHRFFHRADEQDQRGHDTPQLTPCAYDMPCMEIGNADPGRFYEPWPEIR